MNNELVAALDNVLKYSYIIYSMYDKLIELDMAGANKSDIYSEILLLKEEEFRAYDFFRNSHSNTKTVLEYMLTNLPSDLDKQDYLCASRTLKYLRRIYNNLIVNNPNIVTDDKFNIKLFNYLQSLGYNNNRIIKTIARVSPIIEDSVAAVFSNLLEYEIKVNKNINYVENKYHNAFTFSRGIENELIKNDFSFISNNRINDLRLILNNKEDIVKNVISISVEESIDNVIVSFITAKKDITINNLRLLFKAYLLHLSIEEIKNYGLIVSSLDLIYNFRSDILLAEINNTIDLLEKGKSNSL